MAVHAKAGPRGCCDIALSLVLHIAQARRAHPSSHQRRLTGMLSATKLTKVSMKIAARLSNTPSSHTVEVETEGRKQSITIASKSVGRGSSVNGGELLFAALATCFCNDLYREASKRGIDVQGVEVDVSGTFGNPGEPVHDVVYRVQVQADASQTVIDDLIRTTDSLTEIQNTLRSGCAVRLLHADA